MNTLQSACYRFYIIYKFSLSHIFAYSPISGNIIRYGFPGKNHRISAPGTYRKMALYLPAHVGEPKAVRRAMGAKLDGDADAYERAAAEIRGPLAELMVEQAQGLLAEVGYGGTEGPFVEVGIGLDYGEAFVGNIGDRAVYDFTAVGDVVNTASRLQGEAQGGEILVSARLASLLDEPPGEPVEVSLKGKAESITAYRVAVGPNARLAS